MSIETKVNFIDCFFPKNSLEELNESEFPFESMRGINPAERNLQAFSELVIKLIQKSTGDFLGGALENLDANPGDAGCQLRALILQQFSQSEELKKEALELKNTVTQLKLKKRDKETPMAFFQKHFCTLKVSKEMLFLVRCTTMTVTKVVKEVTEKGVTMIKTDMNMLKKFCKNFDQLKDFRFRFIELMAAKLSQESIRFMALQTERVTTLTSKEKQLCLEMLDETQLHRVNLSLPEGEKQLFFSDLLAQTQLRKPKEEKSFTCLFFTIKTLLARIKEEKILIAIKNIVTKGKSFHLFLQSNGKAFFKVADEEMAKFKEETPLIVFEGVLPPELNKETLAKEIEKIGFENLILSCASTAPPFDSNSRIEQIKNLEAREEIENVRKKGLPLQLELDHIFCNTLKKELQ